MPVLTGLLFTSALHQSRPTAQQHWRVSCVDDRVAEALDRRAGLPLHLRVFNQ
jgi:hypothetical protein